MDKVINYRKIGLIGLSTSIFLFLLGVSLPIGNFVVILPLLMLSIVFFMGYTFGGWKNGIKFIFGFILILVIVTVLALTRNSSRNDKEVVRELQTRILPFIEENQISSFFDQDWCKVIKYRDRFASNSSDPNCAQMSESFTEEDLKMFEEVEDILNTKVGKFVEIDSERPLIGMPEHRLLIGKESLGTAFHIDCFFCRTRYVYSPGYKELPPNIEAEIEYTAIDNNWYRVEQDWN